MADIVFMVDGSGSVQNAGFQSAKAFMSQFVDLFNIGPSHTQIGVMIYSSQITFPILLKSYSYANELKNAINGIRLVYIFNVLTTSCLCSVKTCVPQQYL